MTAALIRIFGDTHDERCCIAAAVAPRTLRGRVLPRHAQTATNGKKQHITPVLLCQQKNVFFCRGCDQVDNRKHLYLCIFPVGYSVIQPQLQLQCRSQKFSPSKRLFGALNAMCQSGSSFRAFPVARPCCSSLKIWFHAVDFVVFWYCDQVFFLHSYRSYGYVSRASTRVQQDATFVSLSV